MLQESVLDSRDESPEMRRAFEQWLIFQRELGLRPATAIQVLQSSADPQQALRSLGIETRLLPGVSATVWEALARCAILGVPFPSKAYPRRLARLPDTAPLLLVRGEVDCLQKTAVAIVGSRAATVYGRSVAFKLAQDLASAGIIVVSGLARGIDAEAHRGALAAGGETIAVLGCGPDRIYPSEHRKLSQEIAARGAVVSELMPGAPPRRAHFPLRNRLISGLALAVVVVEARERSGSLITASHALDQGIEVFAVPGPITAPTSAGPNRLLRDGATPALNASDLLMALGVSTRPEAVSKSIEGRSDNELNPELKKILEVLSGDSLTADGLARALQWPAEKLARDLLWLELEGRVATDRNGVLRLVAR